MSELGLQNTPIIEGTEYMLLSYPASISGTQLVSDRRLVNLAVQQPHNWPSERLRLHVLAASHCGQPAKSPLVVLRRYVIYLQGVAAATCTDCMRCRHDVQGTKVCTCYMLSLKLQDDNIVAADAGSK